MIPGIALHVRHRANNGQPCFFRENDYLVYLALLRQLAPKFRCAIHAYCLMTNHVHVLVTPADEEGCGKMMHGVAQRYAYYFNTGNDRTGSLWDGRFRSCLVESADYVLACYRYIELNPVRAGMVKSAGAYFWSSFAANAGLRADPLITPHAEYEAMSVSAYRELVDAGLEEDRLAAIRKALDGGYPLVSERFKSCMVAAGRKLAPGKAGRPARRGSETKSVNVPDLRD